MSAVPTSADVPAQAPAGGLRERIVRVQGTTAYQAVFGVLAVAAVVLLLLPTTSAAEVANLVVWAVFVIDYVVALWAAPDRLRYVRGHLLELVAILPVDFLRAARALRVLRLVRVLRLGIVLGRAYRTLGGVLSTNGLGRAIVVVAVVILLAGLSIWTVEPDIGTPGDGLWWAFVTATTVGYGDISPASAVGRLIALVLMTVGIGLLGLITGSVATFFLRTDTDTASAESPHLAHLRGLLDRWSELGPQDRHAAVALLAQLADVTSGEDPVRG